MAHIIPSDPTWNYQFSNIHPGEMKTLEMLKSDLPDNYWVFHSIHWTSDAKYHVDFGEIDFVVLNDSGDVVFIEQKNGLLDETGGSLIKIYENGNIKDVGRQIHRSIDLVQLKFKRQHRDKNLNPDYLICCPDYKVKSINSVSFERNHIVDATDYSNLGNKIQQLIPATKDKDKVRFTCLKDFFIDAFMVVPDIHRHIEAQSQQFNRQAGTLADILSCIEMTPYRLKIDGVAGCGKSLYGAAYYEQNIRQGKKPMYLCFNNSLAKRLKARLNPEGYINTFHGLCDDFLKAQDQQPDFSKANEPGFWKSMLDKVIEVNVPDNWLFDTVIIDEGQDFEQEWYEVIKLFLKNDAGILWMEDPLQNIYGKKQVQLEGFTTFRFRKNYRSPGLIASYILKIIEIDFIPCNDISGLGVNEHVYDQPDDQIEIAGRLLNELIKKGFQPSDIAILTTRSAQKSILSQTSRIGNYNIRKFTGNYDADGNQLYTEGEIIFDSISRYKGNESPSIILVDVANSSDWDENYKKLMYCGMTRALIKLDIVAQNHLQAKDNHL